ncbi:MAG: T9SS type A sorting domain-containing protein [Candidatus Cloacimonetes bacterium]|nr:T9SS type A sorting domain-containing protein [Candidatus Cloacimonadota bacterium]
MKKIILILFVILSISLLSEEIPAGNVSGEWNLENSPYNINGEISISAGQTLIIEPGVEVVFTGHYKFNIHGQLLAVGTETDTISFTAQNTQTGWHGIRFNNISAVNDSSKISHCILENGNAFGGWEDSSGGAIYISGSVKLIIDRCLLRNNSATGGGGAISRWWSGESIIISNNIICNNNSSARGGGIYVFGSCDDISAMISGNTICNNSSVEGGGIAFWDASAAVKRNIICNNIASSAGGGIHLVDGSSPEIINNTICDNHAVSEGGGIALNYVHFPIFNNLIIYGNTSNNGTQIHTPTTPDLTYCDIQGGFVGTGNIDVDPLFVNAEIDDYCLTENSPCIDAGDPNSPYDPDDTIADIGAIFFNQETDAVNNELQITNFKLRNYPNPFNPTTTIKFNLEQSQQNKQIEIEIYNIKGQKIKKLEISPESIREKLGINEVVWDGKDDSGKPVSSGIYFYQLKVGNNFSETKRMLLLK